MTHWADVSVVSRSCSISGIATLSAVKSLATTNTPNAIATRASLVLRSIFPDVPVMRGSPFSRPRTPIAERETSGDGFGE